MKLLPNHSRLNAFSRAAALLRAFFQIALFLLVLSAPELAFGQAVYVGPKYKWAKKMGGNKFDKIQAMKIDTAGCAHLTGTLTDTVFFENFWYTTQGGSDVFFARTDSAGAILWVKTIGGSAEDAGTGITVDNAGSIYLTGYFKSDSLSFDSTIVHNAFPGGTSLFIARYNTAGTLLWVRTVSDSAEILPTRIKTDGLGNCYVSGNYKGQTTSFGSVTLPPASGTDIFLAKYDSLGNLTWASAAGGPDNDAANGLAVAPSGTCYLAGSFGAGGISFDTTYLTSNGNRDAFLTKIGLNGNVQWSKAIGHAGNENATAVELDQQGYIYLTGNTESSELAFDTVTVTNAAAQSLFLTRHDTTGTAMWARTAACTGAAPGWQLAVDHQSYLLLLSEFSGQIAIDSVTFADTLNTDIALASYTVHGDFVWSKPITGVGAAAGTAFDFQKYGYVSGFFTDSIHFDSVGTLHSQGMEDGFFARFRHCKREGWPMRLNTYCGSPGDVVTIFSLDIGNTTAVYFNGVPATIVAITETAVTVLVPPGFTQGPVTLFTPDLTLATIKDFTPNPVVLVAPASPSVCDSGLVTLTASGAATYSWSTGQTDSVITVMVTSQTSFSVTGTTNGCHADTTVQVQVIPTPEVSIMASSLTVCPGSTATLTASGATSYSWSTGATGAVISVSPAATETYTVTGSTGACADTVTLTIEVESAVALWAGQPVICQGESTQLSVIGGGQYTWSNGLVSDSITVSPPATTTYTATGTTPAGCPASPSVTITVTPLPAISVFPPDAYMCQGQSTTLHATGAASFSWSTSATDSAITVSPFATTTYTVSGMLNGCTGTTTTQVTVNPLPAVLATVFPAQVCEGETAVLQASGADVYFWSTGASGNYASVNPASAQTYTVTGTNGFGCSDTATVFLPVFAAPNVAVTASAGSICSGETITLQASGANLYSWHSVNSITVFANDSVTATPAATTTYSITGTSAEGCHATAAVEVEVRAQNQANAGPAQELCSATSAGLTAHIPANGSSGFWSVLQGNGGSFSNANQANSVFSGNMGETYNLAWTVSGNNCPPATDTTTITFRLTPATPSALPDSICPNQTATLMANGSPESEFSWYQNLNQLPLAAGASFNTPPLTADAQYFVVASIGSCSSAPAPVSVFVLPEPTVQTSPGQEIISGQSTLIQATGAATYAWLPVQGLSNAALANPVAAPAETTLYTVTGTNVFGCSTTGTVEIKVLPRISIANGFTPNGDGVNDTWEIPQLAEFYPNCKVEIYNRWGTLVYTTTGYGKPWNGEQLPASTYYYVVTLRDWENPLVGHVTLIR